MEDYEEAFKQPGILISYDEEGTVRYVEFGCEGYLYRIENGKSTMTKNGTFSVYPK